MKINEDFLTVNKFSRPFKKLIGVNGIVIHWTGNPGTTAKNNRNYFESLKDQDGVIKNPTYASAHFVIGIEGEIIQCLPEDEMAYHVGAQKYMNDIQQRLSDYPNNCTIGIECCVIDNEGTMTDSTYSSLLELTRELLQKNSLTINDIYLHFDITGKACHRWFWRNPKEWSYFKLKVGNELDDCK